VLCCISMKLASPRGSLASPLAIDLCTTIWGRRPPWLAICPRSEHISSRGNFTPAVRGRQSEVGRHLRRQSTTDSCRDHSGDSTSEFVNRMTPSMMFLTAKSFEARRIKVPGLTAQFSTRDVLASRSAGKFRARNDSRGARVKSWRGVAKQLCTAVVTVDFPPGRDSILPGQGARLLPGRASLRARRVARPSAPLIEQNLESRIDRSA